MSFPYILQNNNQFITFINNKDYVVDSDHPKYEDLFKAVLDGDGDTFTNLFTAAKLVQNSFAGTDVQVVNGQVLYKGTVIHNALTRRIINFSERDLPVQNMLAFLNNLMDNPSRRAVEELYNFLEHSNLPITEDGCFLAYKTVRNNYLDKYSGKFDNSVGAVLEMPRNQVDDEANRTCSHGFHVGALEYAGPGGWYNHAGDKVVIVKVNPRDAVSVPVDHNAQKLRVCRYEVVGEYNKPLDDDFENVTNFSLSTESLAKVYADKIEDTIDKVSALANARDAADSTSSTFEYSHRQWVASTGWFNPGRFRYSDVTTARDTYHYSDGSTLKVCYNTNGTIRWVCAKDKHTHTLAFYRFTKAV